MGGAVRREKSRPSAVLFPSLQRPIGSPWLRWQERPLHWAAQDGTVAFLSGHGRACLPTDALCNVDPQRNFSIELCTPNVVLEQDILFYKPENAAQYLA